jgi:hypothetical protein
MVALRSKPGVVSDYQRTLEDSLTVDTPCCNEAQLRLIQSVIANN